MSSFSAPNVDFVEIRVRAEQAKDCAFS